VRIGRPSHKFERTRPVGGGENQRAEEDRAQNGPVYQRSEAGV
jgi:hypothetical protein